MRRSATSYVLIGAILATGAVLLAGGALAQDRAAEPTEKEPASSKSMLDFLRAGGPVGYVIIALSFLGAGLVIESFIRVKDDKLIPPPLVQQSEELIGKGRFSEILNVCKAGDSMLHRILAFAFSQGQLGMDAVREAMQESGTREVTRLQQRVGYIGFIASVAPMLGLLGTVTGMIRSFNVLGMAKGAARPDELAVGISEAMVTTCMGLVVAVPLMFFHNYFRDRVTRIGHDASGQCERLVRTMAAALDARSAARTAPPPQRTEG